MLPIPPPTRLLLLLLLLKIIVQGKVPNRDRKVSLLVLYNQDPKLNSLERFFNLIRCSVQARSALAPMSTCSALQLRKGKKLALASCRAHPSWLRSYLRIFGICLERERAREGLSRAKQLRKIRTTTIRRLESIKKINKE